MSLLVCVEDLLITALSFADGCDCLGIGVVWVCWLLGVYIVGLGMGIVQVCSFYWIVMVLEGGSLVCS